MEHNQAIGKRWRANGIVSERKYNPITRKLLSEKISFYEEWYNSSNPLEFYRDMLTKMYPSASIVNVSAKNIAIFLEGLLDGQNKRVLNDQEKNYVRSKMRAFKIDQRHSNELPSVTRINNYLKKEKLVYSIESTRVTINGERKRYWQIVKHIT